MPCGVANRGLLQIYLPTLVRAVQCRIMSAGNFYNINRLTGEALVTAAYDNPAALKGLMQLSFILQQVAPIFPRYKTCIFSDAQATVTLSERPLLLFLPARDDRIGIKGCGFAVPLVRIVDEQLTGSERILQIAKFDNLSAYRGRRERV